MQQGTELKPRRPLAGLQRKLTRWRRSRGHPGGRIPEAIWQAAVDLAMRHGVQRVAESLRLKRATLERRLSAESGAPGSATGAVQGGDAIIAPSFVEVRAPLLEVAGETCVLELEDRQGVRLKIRVSETTGNLDLAGIVAAFRGTS